MTKTKGNEFQEHSKKFKIGAVFIFFWSVVVGLFNFGVFYLFGIPLLGLSIGIVLVWLSNKSVKVKLLLTFLPIPLIALSFFIAFQLGKAESETFVIPENYRGEIVIFYEEPCGQKQLYANGRRTYKFPENGVLITRFGKTKGFLDQEFHFVNNNGKKTEIPFFKWQKFETEKENCPKGNSTPVEKFTKESVGVFFSYGSATHQISTNSSSFMISNYRYYDKNQKEKWKESISFARKARGLLDQCRQMMKGHFK